VKKLIVVFVLVMALVSFGAVRNPDTFIYASIADPETLDPHYAYDTSSSNVITNIYENLIMYDGASTEDLLPMLASEVPSFENGLIRDGGTTYVFPIRQAVKFHSGNTLTPADIEYSFERALLFDRSGGAIKMLIEAFTGGEFSSLQAWFEDYSGMPYSEAVDANRNPTSPEARELLISFYNEVIDPLVEVEGNNVVFRLAEPYGPFMGLIAQYASWSSILDSEYMKANGAWDGNPDGWWKWHDITAEESPLHMAASGTGPYKLVEWDPGVGRVILERFDDYWREPAQIKTVIRLWIEEFSTRKAMLEAGDADMIEPQAVYFDQFVDDNDRPIIPGTKVELGIPEFTIATVFMIWEIDPDSEFIGSGKLDGRGIPPDFFTDIHVRRGFQHVYNASLVIDEVLNGLGIAVPTNLPRGFFGYDETLPPTEFNLVKAREEFQKAWGGELWEKGFRMTMLYNSGNVARQTICEMMAHFLRMVNPKFQVETQGLIWATYLATFFDVQMPAFVLGWASDFLDPHDFIGTYYSSVGTFGAYHGDAFTKFAQENLDPLIFEALREVDLDRRAELYREIQEIAIENALSFPAYQTVLFEVMRDWVQGFFAHPMRTQPNYYELSKGY